MIVKLVAAGVVAGVVVGIVVVAATIWLPGGALAVPTDAVFAGATGVSKRQASVPSSASPRAATVSISGLATTREPATGLLSGTDWLCKPGTTPRSRSDSALLSASRI